MPKVNKSSIINIKKCDSLKVFTYENSKNYHFSFYVSRKVTRSGNIEKSTKKSNSRDAEKIAKEFYKNYWINFDDRILEKDYSFDKSIAQPFFELRRKQYLRKGKEGYSNKEMKMYENYIKPHLEPINYNEEVYLTSAIEDFIAVMKNKTHNGQKIKDTTISKYTNLISLMCKYGQKKGIMKALPDIPTFARINADRPAYFPSELKQISNAILEEYKKTEDEFWFDLNDYVTFLRSFGTGRTGQNNTNLKVSQFELINDKDNPNQPILYVTLFNTKNKPRYDGSVHNYWTQNHYFNRLKRYELNKFDFMFFPKVKDRKSLYEKIRRSFKRISSEQGLYVFNGSTRPLYSIRHSVTDKRYKETGNIALVAEHMNTDPKIVKSNYLGKSDELRIKRHKEIYPELYVTKSKNKNFTRNLK